jgi:hypothetical protein
MSTTATVEPLKEYSPATFMTIVLLPAPPLPLTAEITIVIRPVLQIRVSSHRQVYFTMVLDLGTCTLL